MSKTLYESAFEKLTAGQDLSEATFRFKEGDRQEMEIVVAAVEKLLARPGLRAEEDRSIHKALLGLRRLPLKTPGLNVELLVGEKAADKAAYRSVLVTGQHIEIVQGTYEQTKSGLDLFADSFFYVDDRQRRVSKCDLKEWGKVFAQWAGSSGLLVVDKSEEALLDWAHPDGRRFWDWTGRGEAARDGEEDKLADELPLHSYPYVEFGKPQPFGPGKGVGTPAGKKTVTQLDQPHGCIWCLNYTRRAEFWLNFRLEKQPGSEEARRMLRRIMLLRDYLFDTTTLDTGLSTPERNEEVGKMVKDVEEIIKSWQEAYPAP